MEKYLVDWTNNEVSVCKVNAQPDGKNFIYTLIEEVVGEWVWQSWYTLPAQPSPSAEYMFFDTKEEALNYASTYLKAEHAKAKAAVDSLHSQIIGINRLTDPMHECEDHVKGCQGDHQMCYGELWICEGCGKSFCWAEGADDGKINMCDTCWAEEEGIDLEAVMGTPDRPVVVKGKKSTLYVLSMETVKDE